MSMHFGMFTDFHIRPQSTQSEAFDESFKQVEAAEELGASTLSGWPSTIHAMRYAAEELINTAANPEVAERLRQTASMPYEEVMKNRLLYGTPEAVIDRLQAYQETLGISGVVLEMNYGGRIPYERIINSIRLLATRVAPKFK